MTRASKKTLSLAAAALLLPAVSCGPKVVVARLASPTAGVSPPAPRASATPTPRPTRVSSPAPTAAARTAQAAPSPTATATAPSARPAPPATATAPPPPQAPAAVSPASPPAAADAAAETSFVGEWDFRADAGKGIIAGTLRFRSVAVGLAGVYVGARGNTTELSNLRAAGGRISFDLVTPTAVWHLEGALAADRIDGTFLTAERTIRWTATRKP